MARDIRSVVDDDEGTATAVDDGELALSDDRQWYVIHTYSGLREQGEDQSRTPH